MRHRTVDQGSFEIRDSAGQIYTVIERLNQVQLNGEEAWRDAQQSYQLVDGRPVNKLKDGSYEVIFNDRQTIPAELCD